MSDLQRRFGKRLRQIRRYKDFTQEQLAEAVGVSTVYVSKLERGVNGPSFEILEKLAEVLQVHVADFFQQGEDQK